MTAAVTDLSMLPLTAKRNPESMHLALGLRSSFSFFSSFEAIHPCPCAFRGRLEQVRPQTLAVDYPLVRLGTERPWLRKPTA